MNKMIPSDSIHVDENGDVIVKKNLEVNKLKPIGEYRFATGKLRNYGTFGGHEDIQILGLEDDDGHYSCIGLGDFSLENQQVSSFAIAGFEFNNDDIMYFSLSNEGTIDATFYSKAIYTQANLYIHTLTLVADKLYTLIFHSTYQSNAGSIAELRNIMNVRATSDNVILPVCASDLSGTAVLQVTTSLCKVGTANVTAIIDKVTTL